jgi:hypothetical protein
MQQRVALPAGAVVEAGGQQPLSGHMLNTAVAAAGADVLVQVADRLGQPGVMRGQHGSSGRWVAEPVEDGDALGRAQDHVKGGHGVAAIRSAEQLAGRRVAALEHGLEPRRRCFALQPKAGGTGAVPPARGLTVARQILLVVGITPTTRPGRTCGEAW